MKYNYNPWHHNKNVSIDDITSLILQNCKGHIFDRIKWLNTSVKNFPLVADFVKESKKTWGYWNEFYCDYRYYLGALSSSQVTHKIYRFPLLKFIVVARQGWDGTRIVAHNNCCQVTTPIEINVYSSILCFTGNHWWKFLCTRFVWYYCRCVMSYGLRICGWPVW